MSNPRSNTHSHTFSRRNTLRTLFISIPLLLLLACGQQQDRQSTSDLATASIAIPSAQCSLCEAAIMKALSTNDAVSDAKVDVDARIVTVTYKAAGLSRSDLETPIAAAGFDAHDKRADPDAYNALPECCKLPEDAGPAMDTM